MIYPRMPEVHVSCWPVAAAGRKAIEDFRIMSNMSDAHGRTEVCRGCEDAGTGAHQRHNPECRKRFEDIMRDYLVLRPRLQLRAGRRQAAKKSAGDAAVGHEQVQPQATSSCPGDDPGADEMKAELGGEEVLVRGRGRDSPGQVGREVY